MNSTVYWIWLSEALGQGTNNIELLSVGKWNARAIYEKRNEIFSYGIYSRQKSEKIKAYPIENAERSYNQAMQNGIKILTPESDCYPQFFRRLNAVPIVLYALGDETVLKNPLSISFVGAREASEYGCAVARALAGAISSRGFNVVSGGARGIDSEAHFGALGEGGKTVCVLGCGLKARYLEELRVMREKIMQSGVLISEYPPFAGASRSTFPVRNRIISALSLGTVVVEAGERSGSLITARLALEQGKDVFAVPGDLVHSSFLGTNKLIRDGATPVFSPNDILETYSFEFSDKIYDKTPFPDDELIVRVQKQLNEQKASANNQAGGQTNKENAASPPKKREINVKLTENAEKIYKILTEEPKHVDLLCELSGLSISQTLSALTELEIYSLTESLSGRRYTIK